MTSKVEPRMEQRHSAFAHPTKTAAGTGKGQGLR